MPELVTQGRINPLLVRDGWEDPQHQRLGWPLGHLDPLETVRRTLSLTRAAASEGNFLPGDVQGLAQNYRMCLP